MEFPGYGCLNGSKKKKRKREKKEKVESEEGNVQTEIRTRFGLVTKNGDKQQGVSK